MLSCFEGQTGRQSWSKDFITSYQSKGRKAALAVTKSHKTWWRPRRKFDYNLLKYKDCRYPSSNERFPLAIRKDLSWVSTAPKFKINDLKAESSPLNRLIITRAENGFVWTVFTVRKPRLQITDLWFKTNEFVSLCIQVIYISAVQIVNI